MISTRLRWLATCSSAVVLLAIAPRLASGQTKNRDVITREEIENSVQKDADIHSVIRALRPHFLQKPRGVRTLGNSKIQMGLYIDGVRESGFDILKNIPASSILEVRYQDPSTAEGEHGQEANGGAVVVKRIKPATVREPDPS